MNNDASEVLTEYKGLLAPLHRALAEHDKNAVIAEHQSLLVNITYCLPQDRIDLCAHVEALLQKDYPESARAYEEMKRQTAKGLGLRREAIGARRRNEALAHVGNLFAAAYTEDPNTPIHAADAGKAYFNARRFEKSIPFLEAALFDHRLSPNDKPYVTGRLVRAYNSVGKRDLGTAAIEYCQRIAHRAPFFS